MPVFHTLPRFAVAMGLALGLLSLTAPSVMAQEIPKVTVTQVQNAEFFGQVAITGTLVARDEIMVNPQVNGQQIVKIYADIGDQVKEGQLLAELDRETLEIQVEKAKAEKDRAEASVLQAEAQIRLADVNLSSARTNHERNTTLLQSGAATQALYDQSETAFKTALASLESAKQGLAVAKTQVSQAEIGLKLAELNLAHSRIVAPAAGVISARNASIGAVANAGPEPMFRIIRDNLIEVSTDVIETDLARISVGDDADLRVAGLGEQTGTVRLVSPRVDPRSRLGMVRISLPADPALRIGIFASGWIATEHFEALAIPVTAVLTDGEGDYTQVVGEDGIIHERRIETGLISGGLRAVQSGLDEGESVVLLAGAFFREGDNVEPVARNEGAN